MSNEGSPFRTHAHNRAQRGLIEVMDSLSHRAQRNRHHRVRLSQPATTTTCRVKWLYDYLGAARANGHPASFGAFSQDTTQRARSHDPHPF